jgi:phosphoribosylglycinamide formyltransferase-1
LRDLRSVGADFIVLAGYMRIVGPTLLDAFPGRIVNVHPSLLPAFPGLDAQKQAIECGAKVSGCTVHFVDAGVDTGPIIVQRALEVEVGETADSLAARILALEHEALPEALRLISEGRVEVEGRRVRIREK